MDEFLKQKADEPPTLADQLTPRECEVLQLVAEGHTNTAIACTLQVSARTVERHRANLMSKLKVNNLPELLRTAIQHRLVFTDRLLFSQRLPDPDNVSANGNSNATLTRI